MHFEFFFYKLKAWFSERCSTVFEPPIHSHPLISASVVAIKLLPRRPQVTLLLDEPLKALFYEYFPLLCLEPFSLFGSLWLLRHSVHSSAHPREFSFHAIQLCFIILSLTWLFRSLTWYLCWPPDNRANNYMTETKLTLVQTSKCISNDIWNQTPQKHLRVISPLI